MNNLSDDPRGGNICTVKAGLVIGDGAKTGPAIGTAIMYGIDGIGYTKAAAATVLPLSVATVQAVSTKRLYLMVVDASGTVTSVAGRAVSTTALANGSDALEWPECPSDKAPFGAVKIETDSTHTFTPGTTALDAAGITETYYDIVGGVPSKPLKS